MGLDVSYYGNVRLEVALPLEDENDERYDDCPHLAEAYVNPDFPAQADGLISGMYEYERDGGFYAGGYVGYTYFREELAKLAGHPPVEVSRLTPRDKWVGEAHPHFFTVTCGLNGENKSFEELLRFSDCEGLIGPATSSKLLRDFDRLAVKAERELSEKHLSLYRSFQEAFWIASGDGMVIFR